MSVKTKVIWENDIQSQEFTSALIDSILAKVNLMKQENKTDGVLQGMRNSPVPEQSIFIRTWVDQAAAEEYLSFTNSLEVPPVSAEILPETPATPE